MVPPFRGNAQGNVQGNKNLTRTQGGCPKNSRGGVPSPPFHLSLSLFGFSSYDRPTRTAPAERDVTGATPPFVPLARHGEWVGVSHGVRHRVSPPSPSGRSLPSVCILAGRLPGPHAGRTTSSDERRDA